VLVAACHAPVKETAGPPVAAPALTSLPAGSTVLFLGDSITWHNHYVAYIESFFALRHPGLRLQFVNRGMRSDTTAGALDRLDRDVVPHAPEVVVVLLGMNDGGHRGYRSTLLRAYLDNMEALVRALREKTRAHIVLVTSTCVEPIDDRKRAYNRMLGAMARGLVDLGRRLGVPVEDLFSEFSSRLAESPRGLMDDPLHPGPAGHLLIAHLLLTRFDPGLDPGPADKTWVADARVLYDLLQERWRWTYYLWDPKDLGPDALRAVWPGNEPVDRAEARRRLEDVNRRIEDMLRRAGSKP
jgi:lysophospholipase L1-like esterase